MPRLHFPIISYAPFLSTERSGHKSYSVQELTNACFNGDNMMIKFETDPRNALPHKFYEKFKKQQTLAEKYISCCLLYRGDVAPTNVHSSIETIKQNKFGYLTRIQ